MLLHVIAGLVGLASGAVALSALKGAELHRKSGMIFVYAMLFLSASGAVIAALKPQRLSVMTGVLAFYLVITALRTVSRPVQDVHWIGLGAMLVALTVGIAGVTLGFQALSSPTGRLDGLPASVGFIFGSVALLAALGDIRVMLAGGIQGASRIARHLWRMCFALFMAAGSFFLGQPQVFPKALGRSGLLAVPVLLVLVLMFYWMARVRFTQRYRRA